MGLLDREMDTSRFSIDWRRSLEDTERSLFMLGGKLVFLLVLFIALTILFSGTGAAAFLGGILAATMLRSILPSERVQTLAEDYWEGDAGLRWYRRWNRLLDWLGRQVDRVVRRGRGVMNRLRWRRE